MIVVSSREFPSSGPSCSIGWHAMNRLPTSVPQYEASWQTWFDKHPRARAVAEDFCLTGVGQNDRPRFEPCSFNAVWRHMTTRDTCGETAAPGPAPSGRTSAGRRSDQGHRRARPARSRLSVTRFPHDLVQEAASAIAGNTLALQHLSEWLNRARASCGSSHGGEPAPRRDARLAAWTGLSTPAKRGLSRSSGVAGVEP